MHKKLILCLMTALIVLIPQSLYAQEVEQISSFTTEISIQKDGSIRVQEQIVYNFGDNAVDRHGIFRTIPITKTNAEGKVFRMEIKEIAVTDKNGEPMQFEETREGKQISLKIGDADRTVSGLVEYRISYTVRGAITYFSDHDELYWNATGNEWSIPIMQADTTISLDTESTSEAALQNMCYTGPQGSSEQNCLVQNSGLTTTYTTTQGLNPYEGMTVVNMFPKNSVAVLEPEPYKEFWETLWGKVVIGALILAGIAWYIVYPLTIPFRWLKYGRDPDVGKPARAWYDPPQTKDGRPLTPAETGTVVDEHVQMRDISAMIVDLAQRGYYTIKETKKNDFTFIKKKEPDDTLLPFEKKWITGLFGSKKEVRLKDAKIESTVRSITSTLYTHLTKEGFFPENPEQVRMFYGAILGAAATTFNIPLLITSSIFGLSMARKTEYGAQAANVGKAMKNFLVTQERQLTFMADKQLMFEKLLPFAVAFGVEKKWAERFKDVTLHEPQWYQGYYTDGFSTTRFASSLHSSVAQVSSAATPASSSSGFSSGGSGGFSGGGGGGGGGGSW